MKQIIAVCFCVLAFAKAYSQQPDSTLTQTAVIEKIQPIDAIKTFFKRFNAKEIDEAAAMLSSDLNLHSLIISTSTGRKVVTTTRESFINNLKAIPDSTAIEERIIEYKSTSNGQIATVTASYEFYLNNEFTHNGTNVFTLFYINDTWMIVAIADTRLYP